MPVFLIILVVVVIVLAGSLGFIYLTYPDAVPVGTAVPYPPTLTTVPEGPAAELTATSPSQRVKPKTGLNPVKIYKNARGPNYLPVPKSDNSRFLSSESVSAELDSSRLHKQVPIGTPTLYQIPKDNHRMTTSPTTPLNAQELLNKPNKAPTVYPVARNEVRFASSPSGGTSLNPARLFQEHRRPPQGGY